MKTIAFFGLGAMGKPMAENLLKDGYAVRTAVHKSHAPAQALASMYNCTILETVPKAADGADVVITILPGDPEVKAFLMDEALMAAIKPGAVVVDMSSCTADAMQEVAAVYAEKGTALVDAPVSGGVSGAASGSLTIFAAGEETAVAAVRPILKVMGSQIFELGACGMGKAFKNLNNLLSIVNLMGVSEVYHIAKAHGYDTNLLYDVVSASSGNSASFKNRWKRMTEANFDGGFKLGLARKDVANALSLGGGIPTPASQLVYELMLACQKYDELDTAAICKLFQCDT